MRATLSFVALVGLGACSSSVGYVAVTLEPPPSGTLANVDLFRAKAMNANQLSQPIDIKPPTRPFTLDSAFQFGIEFKGRSGDLTLTVDALAADGTTLDTGTGSGGITEGATTDIEVKFGALAQGDMPPSGDLPLSDLAMPDSAIPDLAKPDLVGAPDLAHPDLMPPPPAPDLVGTPMPDLVAASLPDLAKPDFAMPDLMPPPPDLWMPDLVTPDLSPCLTDLSNIGTSDFTISFIINTAQTASRNMEILDQRDACSCFNGFDIRMTRNGYIDVETDQNVGTMSNPSCPGDAERTATMSSLNNNVAHAVIIHRVNQAITVTVDGTPVISNLPSTVSFGSLKPVRIGTGPCTDNNTTDTIQMSAVTSLCFTAN